MLWSLNETSLFNCVNCCLWFGRQRTRLNSQRWVSTEEHMTEGDLGLGTIAQLDICTGTAVCSRAADQASGCNMDTQEGGEENSLLCRFTACWHFCSGLIYDCEILHVTTDSSDDDHLTMEDLISYSFQVAKGMEFLSSRKVKRWLFRNLCVCMQASKTGDIIMHGNVNSSVCSVVYPQRSSSQKHPAFREQCGEDLRLWPR